MKLTVEPVSEHTDVADVSTLSITGRSEEAVAETRYVGPSKTASDGGIEVKLMV
jgi:hypothetical protein